MWPTLINSVCREIAWIKICGFFGFEGLFFSSNQLVRLDKADKAFVFCVNLPLFSKATVERAHLSMEQH